MRRPDVADMAWRAVNGQISILIISFQQPSLLRAFWYEQIESKRIPTKTFARRHVVVAWRPL